jgi:hypothetical protein
VGTLCRAVRLSLLGLGPVPHTLTSQVPQFLAHLVDDFELVMAPVDSLCRNPLLIGNRGSREAILARRSGRPAPHDSSEMTHSSERGTQA